MAPGSTTTTASGRQASSAPRARIASIMRFAWTRVSAATQLSPYFRFAAPQANTSFVRSRRDGPDSTYAMQQHGPMSWMDRGYVGAGFKPARALRSRTIRRGGRMTQRTSREHLLRKQGGFESRPYESPDPGALSATE